jgi:hypothetical protein
MRLKLSMAFAGVALMFGTSTRADVAFVLTPATQSGVGCSEVVFAAALTNTDLTTNLYLNNLQLSFDGTAASYLAADTNVFFANVPGILLSDETYTDIVFGVIIGSSAPHGAYSGTVTLQGGSDIFATNNLASQTFQVTMPSVVLNLASAGTNFVLSWLSPPGDFVLQQNSDLTTTNWAATTITPAISNGWNWVVLPPAPGNQFYRLQYP